MGSVIGQSSPTPEFDVPTISSPQEDSLDGAKIIARRALRKQLSLTHLSIVDSPEPETKFGEATVATSSVFAGKINASEVFAEGKSRTPRGPFIEGAFGSPRSFLSGSGPGTPRSPFLGGMLRTPRTAFGGLLFTPHGSRCSSPCTPRGPFGLTPRGPISRAFVCLNEIGTWQDENPDNVVAIQEKIRELEELEDKLPDKEKCGDYLNALKTVTEAVEEKIHDLRKMLPSSQWNLRFLIAQAYCAFKKRANGSGLEIINAIREKFPAVWADLYGNWLVEQDRIFNELLLPSQKSEVLICEHIETVLTPAQKENYDAAISDYWIYQLSCCLHSSSSGLFEIVSKEIANSSIPYHTTLPIDTVPIKRWDNSEIHIIQMHPLDVAQNFSIKGHSVVLVHIIGSYTEDRLDADSHGILSALKENGMYLKPKEQESVIYTQNISYNETSFSLITTNSLKTFQARKVLKNKIGLILNIAQYKGHEVLIFEDNLNHPNTLAKMISRMFLHSFRSIVLALNSKKITETTVKCFQAQGLTVQTRPSLTVTSLQTPSKATSFSEYNQLFERHFSKSTVSTTIPKNMIAGAIADPSLLNPTGTLNRDAIFRVIDRDNRGEQRWEIDDIVYGSGSFVIPFKPGEPIAEHIFSQLCEGLREQDSLRIMCLFHQGAIYPVRCMLAQIISCDLSGTPKPIEDISQECIYLRQPLQQEEPSIVFKYSSLERKVIIMVRGWRLLKNDLDPTDEDEHALIKFQVTISCDPAALDYGFGHLQYSLDGPFTPFAENDI